MRIKCQNWCSASLLFYLYYNTRNVYEKARQLIIIISRRALDAKGSFVYLSLSLSIYIYPVYTLEWRELDTDLRARARRSFFILILQFRWKRACATGGSKGLSLSLFRSRVDRARSGKARRPTGAVYSGEAPFWSRFAILCIPDIR